MIEFVLGNIYYSDMHIYPFYCSAVDVFAPQLPYIYQVSRSGVNINHGKEQDVEKVHEVCPRWQANDPPLSHQFLPPITYPTLERRIHARLRYFINRTTKRKNQPDAPPSPLQIPCTFLYEGGFIVLRMSFPAYVGISEIAPMAATRHKKPLFPRS